MHHPWRGRSAQNSPLGTPAGLPSHLCGMLTDPTGCFLLCAASLSLSTCCCFLYLLLAVDLMNSLTQNQKKGSLDRMPEEEQKKFQVSCLQEAASRRGLSGTVRTDRRRSQRTVQYQALSCLGPQKKTEMERTGETDPASSLPHKHEI